MKHLRVACYLRDGRKCCVCGTGLLLDTERLDNAMHLHHVVYRSRGGQDTLANVIALCWTCHADEHAHRLQITGTAENLCIARRTP